MNSTPLFSRPARLLPLAAVLLLSSCEKELDTYYSEVGPQFPTFSTNALGTASKYATGEVVPFELRFAPQTDPIKEILIYQKIEPGRDSTLVTTIPYKSSFSRIRQADTLVVNYVVPAGANKANVKVDALLVSTNGQIKGRNFSFRLAEATPTISLKAPTNVTLPAGAAPAPGDVVRFPVLINEGGINTASSLTAAGILYNNLDSLITYVKVGTAAERRFARQRVPVAGTQSGAATTVNVDVALPAGSAGQPVVFRFEAKSRFLSVPPSTRSATATAAALTPVAATPLAAARTATLSYAGTTGGDLAAFDLTTFAPVAAASPVATKDVAITSTASNAVRLQALNTTKFVRVATGGAAAYTNATLSSIRQTYQATAAASQVAQLDNVLIGDVYIARLRGLDQYAIFTVTSLNRTSATDVAVTLAIKAL
ncbi:hypothetical protein J7E24_03195 [Hymenobacter sp. ISL-91]|uniref:hypothetical protein n=1 Tax=Hymenobacter sp. ISL-91 TaxID=2819151 RepID=UPI001BEAED03|nr:hypothetical protein [Hymenobacter sp. ISL-91]MBT2556776.1 hypothetical protein [Hymenobacter sp. ISL-91]